MDDTILTTIMIGQEYYLKEEGTMSLFCALRFLYDEGNT